MAFTSLQKAVFAEQLPRRTVDRFRSESGLLGVGVRKVRFREKGEPDAVMAKALGFAHELPMVGDPTDDDVGMLDGLWDQAGATGGEQRVS